MQKIFYNGKIITNNETGDVLPAMLTNEGSVVFVGQNDDVLNLKTEESELVNLDENYVYPALFDMQTGIFNKIDEKIKNAKKGRNFQISSDINENYDNFLNYDEYKNEFLNIQNYLIAAGIGTVFEMNLDKKAFAFWKKISEDKQLKIDIVGFVDLIDSKQVMDDNCVTFRKYKNHFRLGGYYLKMDGEIRELKAWLNKPYSGTKNHRGIGTLYGENLYFLLKTAIDEKKQVVFDVNGDKSIEEILTVFDELKTKEKFDNFYRPIFFTDGFVSKKFHKKINEFDVGLIIKLRDEINEKQIKNFLGFSRKKHYQNLKLLIKNKVRFSCVNFDFDCQNLNYMRWLRGKIKRKIGLKMLKNAKNSSFFTDLMKKIIYLNPAYFCFDDVNKAGLDNQKQAKFFVLDGEIFSEKTNLLYSKMEDEW